MDIDYGVIIGLIGTVCIAGVLGLSYVGAFLMGQARGRRDAEREMRLTERDDARIAASDRLLLVETAVDSVARAVERLTDAQRVVLLEQARLVEGREPSRPPIGPRNASYDTPA